MEIPGQETRKIWIYSRPDRMQTSLPAEVTISLTRYISLELTLWDRFTSYNKLFIRRLRSPDVLHTDFNYESSSGIISTHPDIIYDYGDSGCINWCSAPRPGYSADFAIGRTGHWAILNDQDDQWGAICRKTPPRSLLPKNDDILSVDWLDSNVVIGGARSGRVLLGDVRTTDGGTALRLLAHRGIQHVRALDSNRIVVAALENEVCPSLHFRHL